MLGKLGGESLEKEKRHKREGILDLGLGLGVWNCPLYLPFEIQELTLFPRESRRQEDRRERA